MPRSANAGSAASTDHAGGGGRKWLAILRIYLGAYFIHQSLGKFTASYIGEFSRMVSRWSHDASFAWYRTFLDQYVAPHSKFFAYATAVGEFYVGVALLVGFLSGLAAILGLAVYLNYTLGNFHSETLWNYSTIMMCLLVILFTGAGRVMGLDKYLARKILFKYLV